MVDNECACILLQLYVQFYCWKVTKVVLFKFRLRPTIPRSNLKVWQHCYKGLCSRKILILKYWQCQLWPGIGTCQTSIIVWELIWNYSFDVRKVCHCIMNMAILIAWKTFRNNFIKLYRRPFLSWISAINTKGYTYSWGL